MTLPTFTPAEATLLERGYPHIAILVEGHEDDAPKQVDKAAKKALLAVDPVYFVQWPRGVAIRFAWGFAQTARSERRALEPLPSEVPPLVNLAPWIEQVITRASVSEGPGDYGFQVQAFLYLLEAWHGTDVVLNATVSAYAALAKIESKRTKCRNYAANEGLIALGALLHRASPKAAKAARAKLKALLTPKASKIFVFANLECLLDGKKAAKRQGLEFIYPVVWLFQSDAAFALRGITGVGGDVFVDVRGAWLAGEDAIDAYLKFVPKIARNELPFTIESFGMLKTPRVIPMMKALSQKPGGETASAWLRTRGKQLGAKDAKSSKPAKASVARSTKSTKAKKPALASAERELDELTDWVVMKLGKARGKKSTEAEILRQAAATYMEIRSSVDEPASHYLGHFFMVDGVGLSKSRPSVWERLKPSQPESRRWAKLLEALESNA